MLHQPLICSQPAPPSAPLEAAAEAPSLEAITLEYIGLPSFVHRHAPPPPPLPTPQVRMCTWEGCVLARWGRGADSRGEQGDAGAPDEALRVSASTSGHCP
jgi:hypothetical protein